MSREKLDKRLYNIEPGERQKIWDAQGGLDPITRRPLVATANLDHDHRTGLVRGLLNPMTNKYLVDDIEKLRAMLAYVMNPPAPAALGERVYGLIGKAQVKKVMRYGPAGTREPHARKGTRTPCTPTTDTTLSESPEQDGAGARDSVPSKTNATMS